jgi:hypothetical protein
VDTHGTGDLQLRDVTNLPVHGVTVDIVFYLAAICPFGCLIGASSLDHIFRSSVTRILTMKLRILTPD